MTYSEVMDTIAVLIDLGIFLLLIVWAWMDRNNIYIRKIGD